MRRDEEARALPDTVDDIGDAWISEALRGPCKLGADAAIEILGTEPVGVGETYASLVHRLHLAGPHGTPSSVIVKLPIDGGLRAMVDAIGAYRREVVFYREIAGETPLACPRCYLAEQATDSTDFVIVMQDLAPLRSADQLAGLTLAQASAMMDTLAKAHAWSWEHPRLEELADVFPSIGSENGRVQLDQFAQNFAATWPIWQGRAGDAIGPNAKTIGDAIPTLIDFFVRNLASPRTITLGDLRADNLFFTPEGAPIVVDFQLAQQECGLREVAYLLSQSLPVEVRRGHDVSLVSQYHAGLVAAGVNDLTLESAWRQYRIAVAYNLMWPVLASMAWDQQGERGRTLLVEMTRRASAAIDDMDAVSLLPLLTTGARAARPAVSRPASF